MSEPEISREMQHLIAEDAGGPENKYILELQEEILFLKAKIKTLSGLVPEMMDLQHKNINLIHQMGDSHEHLP